MRKAIHLLIFLAILFSCNLDKTTTSHLSSEDSLQVLNILKESNGFLNKDKFKAGELAENALAICSNKNTLLEVKSYNAFAASQHYYISQDSLLGIDLKALHKATLISDSIVLHDTYFNYANDLITFNIIDKADSVLRHANAIAKSLNNNSVTSRQLYLQGLYTFKLQSDLPKTESLFKQSLSMANDQNNQYLVALNKQWIFATHIAKGEFDSSIKLAFEALDFFELNGYADDAAGCRAFIGDSYKNQGNIAKSIEFLSKAYPVAVHAGNYITAIKCLTLLDYDHFVNNHLDSIAGTLPSLNKYADALSSPFFTATVKGYAGRYFTWKKNYDTAMQLFHEAEALAEPIKAYRLQGMLYAFEAEHFAMRSKNAASDSMQVKAYLAFQKGVPKELIENSFKTAEDSSGEHLSEDTKTEKRLYTDSAFAASQGKEAIKSFRHGEDTIEIRPVISVFDSSISVVYNKQLMDYETKYKTKQKEDSLRIQMQQTIIAQQNIRRQNIVIALIAVIAVLLGIGFYLQYKNRKRTEKDKAKIELLQNEVHHRVKNNLAIIKRFVDVAKQSGSENISLNALQGRIAAIELLHKNLYQSNVAGQISLQEYLDQLVKGISNVFTDENSSIDISIHTPVTTDMKTAEKIGLLVNELLTNSIKYAFDNNEGKIKITAATTNDKNFILSYTDNGKGYNIKKTSKGYGSRLIKGIAGELNGNYTLTTDNGVQFTITI